jgi:hypothetical protein
MGQYIRTYCAGSLSPESASPSSSGGVPFTQLELLEATHRGLHKFVPRHHDEIEVEIGDPIYVQKEADDLWCEGTAQRRVLPNKNPSTAKKTFLPTLTCFGLKRV